MISLASGDNRSIVEFDRVEGIEPKGVSLRNSKEACNVISHWKKMKSIYEFKERYYHLLLLWEGVLKGDKTH